MRRRTFLIPLLFLCFVPLTILHAQQPDMHSLQQQLAGDLCPVWRMMSRSLAPLMAACVTQPAQSE